MIRFLQNVYSMCIKEYLSILRDKGVIVTLIAFPLLQITLFGYVINQDPKHINTILHLEDRGPLALKVIQSLENTQYFKIVGGYTDLYKAKNEMDRNRSPFIISIPASFTDDIIRNQMANIILISDGSEPGLGVNAFIAFLNLSRTVLNYDLQGSLGYIQDNKKQIINPQILQRYNPENKTNIVILPALIGVIISLSMIYLTAISLVREYEFGTIETLLSSPLTPLEILFGKLTPYIIVAYGQFSLTYFAVKILFEIPNQGSLTALIIITFPFILCNLVVGIFFSTISKSTTQAMQFAGLFFLPSIILGGFFFPFQGMPEWAQFLSNLLPLTNYLRLVRGIMVKGGSAFDYLTEIQNMILFIIFVSLVTAKLFRKYI